MLRGKGVRTVLVVLCISMAGMLACTTTASAEANVAAVSYIVAPNERDKFRRICV